MSVRYGIDERVKVKGWQVRVLRLDEDYSWMVVPGGREKEKHRCGEDGTTGIQMKWSTEECGDK